MGFELEKVKVLLGEHETHIDVSEQVHAASELAWHLLRRIFEEVIVKVEREHRVAHLGPVGKIIHILSSPRARISLERNCDVLLIEREHLKEVNLPLNLVPALSAI